MLLSKQVRIC